MKKICSVVGARPQFIKLAVVSRELRKYFSEVLIHTGQHYDHNMSDVFFEEMEIPKPDYNLGISGGTHGKMTGEMLIRLEEVFLQEQPDLVLLFGDTNSTMAAALAAVKLHIPICHVEAGNRFGTLDSPEEVNRIVTDHLASINLPCTESSLQFLEREGLGATATVVGDPMYDAFRYYTERLDGSELQDITDFAGNPVSLPQTFYYMTCHRQENTDTDEKLRGIFDAMESPGCPDNLSRASPQPPACPAAPAGVWLPQPAPDTAGGLQNIHFPGESGEKDCHRFRRRAAGGLLCQKALRHRAGFCGLARNHGGGMQFAGKAGQNGYSRKAVCDGDL